MTNRTINRFKENRKGFWKDYRWWIVGFFTALMCDSLSTIHFMLKYGAAAEAHPPVYFVSLILGPVAGPLLGLVSKAAAGLIVAIYCRRFAAYFFITAIIISLWAAWYNIWGINLYTPNILKWIPW